jgi:glycosyltransferase involved in cell wall biosynthesis
LPGFHAILVLRDEADIIAQTLEHLLSWCDTLMVYDTGSLDDTWEIVEAAAARDKRIVLVGKEPVLFVNGLRAWVFDQHRRRFRAGDWIARVDADEFYHIPPPRFIRERLSPAEGRLCARMYEFVITRSELKAWQDGRETLADRARPIADRRRFYRLDDYPELRLFRYRRAMHWPFDRYDPLNGGLMAIERIPVRHYRSRDPVQVQVRCALRASTAPATAAAETHWYDGDWRRMIVYDHGRSITHWPPGEPLPESPARNHLAPPLTRAAQHLLYRTGLIHLQDQIRRKRPTTFPALPLPPEVAQRMRRYIAAIEERPYLRDTPLQARERAAEPADGPVSCTL